ncbi:MAG: aminoglycoside phosphotransferase family protein [Proteobacteria bacterium]|nr:aminoglycoside phosphotransferase family protein [Pseudomonadota bacterium]
MTQDAGIPDTPLGEALYGGLQDGRVWRVGDTVRRPAGEWTATVHALLRHLGRAGFPAPRPLGLDGLGREILTFLPGRAGLWPWPDVLKSESGARQVGQMLWAYHGAVRGFAPPSPAVWRHGPQQLAPGQIVLHGDFGPYNLIWDGPTLNGVIDFELARPGDPLEDAAFAAIRIAPLRPDAALEKIGFSTPPDRRARLMAFAEGYGVDPEVLVARIIPTQMDELRRIEAWGGEGLEPWATFLRKGLADEVRAELAWMTEHLGALAIG